MKYFAIIDGEKRGPFELEELPEAGVRPSTYVWCKGMADWEKAEDVADICRLYRGRLYDLLHPVIPAPGYPQASSAEQLPQDDTPSRFDRHIDAPLPSIEEIESRRDVSRPPVNMVPYSILVTLLCNPLLGIFAIIYAFGAQKSWRRMEEMAKNEAKNNAGEVEEMRRSAHNLNRIAMMVTGLAFFIGLIIYGAILSRYLS